MPNTEPKSRSVQTVPYSAIKRDARGRPTIQPERITVKTSSRWNPKPTRATQTIPRMDLITPVIAVDCEFQEVYLEELGKCRHRVGRVSIVNYDGRTIYDVFAFYPEEAGKRKKLAPWRLGLGVYWEDIKLRNGACLIEEVELNVEAILHRAEIVVGHAVHNDIKVFSPGVWEGVEVGDTQIYEPYREWGIGRQRLPKLSVLAWSVLGWSIQSQEHSSVEDAQATMLLDRANEAGIEQEQGGQGGLVARSQELEAQEEVNGTELEEDPEDTEGETLEGGKVQVVEVVQHLPLSESGVF
ncbi:hypothetical protein KC318_g4011 [Hortaea werneckii]|uniref:Exonuclease domain-containing protein n=1 Tax=Hortaea werneckii TaxID=91943 RepID=A0A3M7BKT2_HORWE|nr:hypothetical protein KC334_g3878 [Hortaea werneckii]KAI7024347.1 hypothetical protein KC355_g1439 [Hortaea werneckii]KAI7670486.1 hypothetical protein KC318_g4011 [Hortaea werneckii]RMY24694.1 hypothetical protein D0867_01210 [Hortaea werneckii]RMY40130.1 hypothetical protein D0866_01469 [Hortaea werneckii]